MSEKIDEDDEFFHHNDLKENSLKTEKPLNDSWIDLEKYVKVICGLCNPETVLAKMDNLKLYYKP